MTEKALASQSSHLAPWGGKDAVNAMATRLKMSMPGARKLDNPQAMALAQIAIAHELDPFNGEVWFIPGSGVMVGIKGLRKAARRQLRKEHGGKANFWTDFVRVTSPDEYGTEDDDLVYECRLRDEATMDSWGNTVERFVGLGSPLDAAIGYAGPAPVTVGVGIYKKDESTRMQPNEAARKRAEANALKQRFDVDFAFEVDVEHDVVEADYVEVEPEKKTAEEHVEELGYEVEKPEEEKPNRPYDAAGVQKAVTGSMVVAKTKGKRATGPRRAILAAQLTKLVGSKEMRYTVSEYLVGEPSTGKMGSEMVVGLLVWLFGKRWESADFNTPISDIVIAEAQNVIEAVE